MKATPDDQQRLLQLQSFDQRVDQLGHKRTSLPEHAELDRVNRDLAGARDLIVAAQTERSDIERERVRADADVEQVRNRITRDQQRLTAGGMSGKDLEAMQHEVTSLHRRQSELEDVELEVLERIENIDSRLAELHTQVETLESEQAQLQQRLTEVVTGLESELTQVHQEREALTPIMDAALVTAYERKRERHHGVVAGELRQKRCGACRMELMAAELSKARTAAADELLTHEDCGAFLVRTDESGL